MKENETLGERIARITAEKGKTLHWLARKAGICYSSLYSAARRKSDGVNRVTLEKIAESLEIPVTEILYTKTGSGESDEFLDGGDEFPPLKPNHARIVRKNGETRVMINFSKSELLSMLESVGISVIANDLLDLTCTYDLTVELRPEPIEKEEV